MKTTEHYMENGRKSKDSQMVGDYGVEEWRDGGRSLVIYLVNKRFTLVTLNMDFGINLAII